MSQKKVVIIGGGTFSWSRNHLALAAPAFGSTARRLDVLCREKFDNMDTVLHLTKMAGGDTISTNEDLEKLVSDIVDDLSVKVVFFTASVNDWQLLVDNVEPSKNSPRLSTSSISLDARLYRTTKIISEIRRKRKDIFLVGFKQTYGSTEHEQSLLGLRLCKDASCNLVLANDTKTRLNMIITPEEAKYHVTTDREEVLSNLVEMTKLRSHLTFTRSTVIAGDSIDWNSDEVPESLRKVVNYCIEKTAYKPFNGATVGHFAAKVNDTTFLTSKRKTNFNDLSKIGLVKIVTDGPDTVLAYGAKPSVGGQSQRIVFKDHPGMDCIVHFHCPIKEGSLVPVKSQREYECGSHECGENTSKGLQQFGNLKAVYLDQHGPNIVFNKNIDPQEVIDFIEDNFDLNQKTGGYVL